MLPVTAFITGSRGENPHRTAASLRFLKNTYIRIYVNKLTLSVSRDVAERAKARARRLGSLSAVVEDFLWTLDGEGLADVLCRDLDLECGLLPSPGEVAAGRPRAVGPPASELVAELRRERYDDIS
jgi:hypothetical protein